MEYSSGVVSNFGVANELFLSERTAKSYTRTLAWLGHSLLTCSYVLLHFMTKE